MGPYPNRQQIEDIFAHRGEPDVFNPHFVTDLDAVVVGEGFNLGGTYTGIESFTAGIFGRVAPWLEMDTIRIEVTRVIGADENGWGAVESKGTATTIYGKPYNMEWVDLIRFDDQGKIAQIKEYLDTGHLHRHVEAHETKGQKP